MAFIDYEQFPDIPNDYITKSSCEYANERELYQVVSTEAFNMWGTPISYYHHTFNTSANPMYGEDTNQMFTSAVEMMAMFTLPNRSRVYNQFGIISVETFNVYITMDHFDAMSGGLGYKPYTGMKPQIGDVIRNHYRDPFGYAFYEISNVNYTDNQFEQDQQFWTLTCKLYNDNYIKVDPSLASNPIYSNSDQHTDIFDITSAINNTKGFVNYTGTLEKPGNSKLLGQW